MDVWIAYIAWKPMIHTYWDADWCANGVEYVRNPERVEELNISNLRGSRRDKFMSIGFVPDVSAYFPNLKTINVGSQPWASKNVMIPRNIGAYKNLTALWIDDAQIDHLPEEIGELSNLIRLVANNNCISVIPDSIGKLTHLEVLNLSDNDIRVIPPAMKAMTSLNLLHLKRNKITDVFTYFNLPENLLVRSENPLHPYECYITLPRADGTIPTITNPNGYVIRRNEINLNFVQLNKRTMQLLARKMRIPLEHNICRTILEKIITRDIILD